MRVSRSVQAAADIFIGAKTSVAIPTGHPLVRDALVLASLDPAVRSIDFVASARVGATSIDLDAITTEHDDGRFYLDVVPARPVRDAEHEGKVLIALRDLGLTAITLTAADIKGQPRFANSNLVWSYRMHPVGIGLRMRALQILADDGPMTLSRLLTSVRSNRDPSPAIMALACSDLLELDLISRPLGPATIVRERA